MARADLLHRETFADRNSKGIHRKAYGYYNQFRYSHISKETNISPVQACGQ